MIKGAFGNGFKGLRESHAQSEPGGLQSMGLTKSGTRLSD